MATTLSQYGLLPDDQKKQTVTGATNDPTTGGQNGQLSNPFANAQVPALNSSAAPTQLPQVQQYAFNPKYAAISQALEARLADAGLDRSNAINALDQSYQQNVSDAERNKGKAINNLVDRFAGQGILWSGINTGAQADLSNDFQRYLGGLANSRANSLGDIERGYAGTIRDVNTQRAGLFAQQGQEEEAQRLESARQAQAAEAARQQAAAMQALQQQMIAAQQAALAAQPSAIGGGGAAYSASVGAPTVGGGGGGGAGDNPVALMGMIQSSNDWNFLNSLTQAPQVQADQSLMDAVLGRIRALTAAGTAQQKQTGNYQRTKAY